MSVEHASLLWVGDRWELRDLGSRNGTWIGGHRLSAGERTTLAEGAVFALGPSGKTFVLVDAAAPVPGARHVNTGELRSAVDGLLVLPDDDHPVLSVFEDVGGRWVVESDEAKREARDHEIVTLGGDAWVLELPAPVGLTWESGVVLPTLETVDLHLAVSRNEEHVEVSLSYQGKRMQLAPRTYHYLLVVLARARLADHAASPSERGWVDRAALCRMLAVDRNRLNVDVFRLRKQLGRLGVQGISGLVMRRAGSGQIRLGTDRVDVSEL